jgi:hypothetical protein
MFLPDYLEAAFDSAKMVSLKRPLVQKKHRVLSASPYEENTPFFTPALVFWDLFAIILLLTFWEIKRNMNLLGLDVFLFSVYGGLGMILLLLWVATDHKSGQNYNLLWAFPLHLPLALLELFSAAKKWVKWYFLFTILLTLFLLTGWYVFPQKLHPAILPLALIIGIRAFYQYAPDVFRSKLSKLPA